MFLAMLATPGMHAVILHAASLGTKGSVSESNVPLFLPEKGFSVQRLFEIPRCLTRIAEVLRSLAVESQLG